MTGVQTCALPIYKTQYLIVNAALGDSMDNMYLLADTMANLYKIGRSKGWIWDLHYGNIMLRADGTPVINDPWVIG